MSYFLECVGALSLIVLFCTCCGFALGIIDIKLGGKYEI